MRKFLFASVVVLATTISGFFVHAQSPASNEAAQKAELAAAFKAASKAGTDGPADVPLIDQATLKLADGDFFIPKPEGARVLRALGNVVNDTKFVGLVVGKGSNDNWIVVINYVNEGYIKDDDAKNWNADDLLKNLRDGAEEANKDRVARGFPEMEVVRWIEPPAYDAVTHRLVWSVLGKDKGEPDTAATNINYNTYALGRDGYFSLNLLSSMDRIANEKSVAHTLLDDLAYRSGKRYEDFNATTDRIAEYGLAALVGGIVAKKLGLFALLLGLVVKFGKIIVVAAVVFGAAIMRFFRRTFRGNRVDGTT